MDLGKYIAFIHKFHPYLESYMNLDVMPGTPGGVKTQSQVEESAKQGWANLMRMRKEGLNPIPVYHIGERRYWLEKMLGEGFGTLALGGVAPLADEVRKPWLDEIWDYLCRPTGYPVAQVHGLGITSTPLILRYPWTSVDSVSWLQAAANGTIYVPRWDSEAGEYSYSVAPWVVHVSVQSNGQVGKSGHGHGRHLHGLGPSLRRYVLRYLNHEGLDPDKVAQDYIQRDRVNIRFFQRLSKAHPLQPFHCRDRGLFGRVCQGMGAEAHPTGKFHVYLAIAERRKYGDVLNLERARRQLVTYFWFQNREIFDIPRYITTGVMVYTPRRGSAARVKIG